MRDVGSRLEHPCPECGCYMILKQSKYGLFYGCVRFPSCGATHGAHKKTGEPLGIPVDKETKEWRIKAHSAFDKIWKGGEMKRKDAYRWMRKSMKLSPEDAHIGRFDINGCKRLISLVSEKES